MDVPHDNFGKPQSVPLGAWGRADSFCLLFLLFAATALRLYRLGDETPWADEVFSLWHLPGKSLWQFLADVRKDNAPTTPLYFVIEYFWVRFAGNSVELLRILSIAMGLAHVALLYVMGRAWFGRWAGFVAAMCAALSLRHIQHDQEIRMYVLAVLLAAASVWSLWKSTQDGRWLVVHYIVNAALMWTHLLGAFLFVAEGLWLTVLYWRAPRYLVAWGLGQLPAILSVAWYASSMNAHAVDIGTNWAAPPDWRDAIPLITWPGIFLGESTGAFRLAWQSVAIPLLLLTAWMAYKRPGARAALLLALLWCVVPAAVLLIASYARGRGMLIDRYGLYMASGFFLVLGGLAAQLPRASFRVGAIAALLFLFCMAHWTTARPFRVDYHAAAIYLEHQAKDDDVLIMTPHWTPRLMLYQLPPNWLKRVLGEQFPANAPAKIAGQLTKHETVWYLPYRRMSVDERATFESELKKRGIRFEQKNFDRGRILLFRLKKA